MDPFNRAMCELPEVRFEGTHRRVAMRSSDWEAIRTQIPRSSYVRLTSAFRRFCRGCNHMPDQVFRRCAGSGFDRLEEFVADGVRVIGRRGNDEAGQTFFTIQVLIDVAVDRSAEKPASPQQAALPFDVETKRKDRSDGQG